MPTMISPMARKRRCTFTLKTSPNCLRQDSSQVAVASDRACTLACSMLAAGAPAGRLATACSSASSSMPSLPARSAWVKVAMASTAHLLVAILETGELARSGINTPAKMNWGMRITGIKAVA